MKFTLKHLVTGLIAAFLLGGITVISMQRFLPKSGALSRTCAEGSVQVSGECVAGTYQNRAIAQCEASGMHESNQCSLSAEVCSELDEPQFAECYTDFLSGFGTDENEAQVLSD